MKTHDAPKTLDAARGSYLPRRHAPRGPLVLLYRKPNHCETQPKRLDLFRVYDSQSTQAWFRHFASRSFRRW